jgi:hypothetical protein
MKGSSSDKSTAIGKFTGGEAGLLCVKGEKRKKRERGFKVVPEIYLPKVLKLRQKSKVDSFFFRFRVLSLLLFTLFVFGWNGHG